MRATSWLGWAVAMALVGGSLPALAVGTNPYRTRPSGSAMPTGASRYLAQARPSLAGPAGSRTTAPTANDASRRMTVTRRTPAVSGKKYDLRGGRTVDALDHVVIILDAGGTLKDMEDGKIVRPKTSVVANFSYDERTLALGDSNTPARSVRHYDQAKAVVKVDQGGVKPTLPDDRRLIGVELGPAGPTLFSPQGPLTRDQLDLVDILGNSLLVDRLLPSEPVAKGERWTHPNDVMTALLRIDSLKTNDVTSTLDSVDANAALMTMVGRIEGAIGGVTTRMEVQGKYRFDRATRRIDWLGLLVKEDRDIGHVDQGVDVAARLRMQIKPIDRSEHLTDAALGELPLSPTEALTRLTFQPEGGGWRIATDRRWFPLDSHPQVGVLRMIDRGEFVAQCNFATLAPVKPGNQMTLERFQQGIREALGERFGEFVHAGQQANDKDYRVLRVVVRGVVSELPIEWRYYLVADKAGRQVSFTFSVEKDLVQRLGDADQDLVRSVQFNAAPSVASRPTKSR